MWLAPFIAKLNVIFILPVAIPGVISTQQIAKNFFNLKIDAELCAYHWENAPFPLIFFGTFEDQCLNFSRFRYIRWVKLCLNVFNCELYLLVKRVFSSSNRQISPHRPQQHYMEFQSSHLHIASNESRCDDVIASVNAHA